MAKLLTDWAEKLWEREDLPVAALVAYRSVAMLLQNIPNESGQSFQRCNTTLLHWWPEQPEFLSEIYETRLRDCWEAYYQLKPGSIPEKTAQIILQGLYVQMRVLQRFENKSRAPSIGNDLRDTSIFTFRELLQKNQEYLSDKESRDWQQWCSLLLSLPRDEWNKQVKALAP